MQFFFLFRSYKEQIRETKKKKKLLKYTETLVITLLISLKRSQRDESNNIKKKLPIMTGV